MGPLIIAFRNLLINSSSITSLVGDRVYFGSPDSGAKLPYIVFHNIPDAPDNTFTEHYDNYVIQVSIFSPKSDGALAVSNIFDAVAALLEEHLAKTTLLVSGYTTEHVKQASSPFTTIDDMSVLEDGTTGMYIWTIDFNISLSLN